MPGFVLLVRARNDGDAAMRVGFTVTKKIGNAVVRNRLKRRLRALAHELLPTNGVRGADHVLIGRGEGVERDYARMRIDLGKALAKLDNSTVTPGLSRRPVSSQRRQAEGPRVESGVTN